MAEDKNAATKQLTVDLYKKYYRAYLSTSIYVRDRIDLNLIWAFSLIVWGMRSSRPHTIRKIPVVGVEASIPVMQGD